MSELFIMVRPEGDLINIRYIMRISRVYHYENIKYNKDCFRFKLALTDDHDYILDYSSEEEAQNGRGKILDSIEYVHSYPSY